MKFYTKPRPLQAAQLRIGDQVALAARDEFVASEAEYLDLDLADDDNGPPWLPLWGVVHGSGPNTIDFHPVNDWMVVYTQGTILLPRTQTVIVREVVEVDPWSYVQSA
jgi:hypothetical protein